MAIRLLALEGMPDDEAEEILELLTANDIDFYTTPPGPWGLWGAMVWLKKESQLGKAKELIAGYQRERTYRAREEYIRLKREGKNPTLGGKFHQEPFKVVLYLALIVLILYLSIIPFIYFI